MTVGRVGLIALVSTCCGCLRFAYEPRAEHKPDASHSDAGVMYVHDAAVSADAAAPKAGASGSAGAIVGARGGSAAGRGASAGRGAAGTGAGGVAGSGDEDAGAAPEPMLGDTDLRVSDILGFYSGDWGDMVLEKRDAEIWGVFRYNDGTIIGAVTSEGVFSGWWTQLPTRDGNNAGEVEFRWLRSNAGVIQLDGRWRYGTAGTWLENWDVDLVTHRAPPSELSDAFQDIEDFRRHP